MIFNQVDEALLRSGGEGLRRSAHVSEDVSGVTAADDGLTESPGALGSSDWPAEFADANGIDQTLRRGRSRKSPENSEGQDTMHPIPRQSDRRKFSMCCLSSSFNRLNCPTT